MAEKSIGELSAKISANATGFNAGIDGAIKKAEAFHGHIGRMLSAPLAGVSSIAGAPGKAISAFMQPIQGALSSIPLIGGALSAIPASAGGFMGFMKEAEDRILAQKASADKLGVSMQRAAGVKLLAGERSEEFEKAIGHFQVFMGAVRAGSPEAEKKLKALGLSPEDVSGKSTERNYEQVRQKIAAMADESDRARARMEAFGKGGMAAGDLLAKSWDAATQKAGEYGLAVTRQQAQEIKQMQAAEKVVGKHLEGAMNQAAVSWYGPAKEFAMRVVGEQFGHPGDYYSATFSGAARQRMFERQQAIEMEKYDAGMAELAKPIRAEPGAMNEEQKTNVDAFSKKLQEQADTYAMTARQAEIYKLQTAGIGDEHLRGVQRAASYLDALDKVMAVTEKGANIFERHDEKVRRLREAFRLGALDLKAFADGMKKLNDQDAMGKANERGSIFNQTRTPSENFFSKVKELQQLFPGGGDTFNRAVADAYKKSRPSDTNPYSARPIEEGSGEALEMMQRLNNAVSGKAPTKENLAEEFKQGQARELLELQNIAGLTENVVAAIEANKVAAAPLQ